MNEIIRPLPQEEALRRLREKLAEHVPANKLKERDGPSNSKIKYINDDYILTKLDEIFGPLNWDRKVLEESIAAEFRGAPRRKKQKNWDTKQDEWVDFTPDCVVARARCQITVRYANQVAVYEDVGTIVREVDLKDKPAAYMMAIKGAVTDGYKRCAAQIGNIFGRGLLQNGQQTNDPDYSDAVFVEANVYVIDPVTDGEIIEAANIALPPKTPAIPAPDKPASAAPTAAPALAAAVPEKPAPAAPAAPANSAMQTAGPAAQPTARPAAAAEPPPAKPATDSPAAVKPPASSAPAAPPSAAAQPTATAAGTFAPGAKFAADNNAAPAGAARGQPVTSTLNDLRAMYKEIEADPLKWNAEKWRAYTVAFSNVIANAEAGDIEPLTKALSFTETLVTNAKIGSVVKDIPIWLAAIADRLKRRRVSFGMS